MQKKRIYTVATAHLDTTWLWDLETTIKEYLPITLKRNFSLFEKYPDYVFNFEGSYRYELIEEYYPEDFKKLKEYVEKGNWAPAGSCYENGDVNVPSPEALYRNILYGNNYFKKKFNKPSNDIFIPDCFGFGWSLPTIAAHANLKGFSTQKLSWGSTYGQPFDIGKWYGPDGRYIFAAIKPGSYTQSLLKIRDNKKLKQKLLDNISKYSLPFTHVYHGIGDRGGSPSEDSVRNVYNEALQNSESDTEVISASSSLLFDDLSEIPDNIKEKMPQWNNELLLTTHGAGSYTSRTVGKRWNRRSEQLADAAERNSVAANILTGSEYPRFNLEKAWKSVIAHQFHDDLTGTSFQKCYKRNWNDYVQAMNMFSEEYRSACANVSTMLDTSFVKGTAVIVNNPIQNIKQRKETVTARIKRTSEKNNVKVFNSKGKEVLSQLISSDDEYMEIAFCASVPSVGFEVYDIRPDDKGCTLKSSLSAQKNSIENKKFKLSFDNNGHIKSIYDKAIKQEMLSAPICFSILKNLYSKNYPAWEITYRDISDKYKKNPLLQSYELVECGPARIVLKLKHKLNDSVFTQNIVLDNECEFIKVFNEVDWRHTASLLKIEYCFTASSKNATYDIGAGVIERKNNTEKLYEVPAQQWADISDLKKGYGVSVLSDSKSGWDKPASNCLRLTCIHTPKASYRWESSQHLMDLGINRFGYGIFPHKDNYTNGTQLAAAEFNQPMNSFVAEKHKGSLDASYSFASLNTDEVLIKAVKLCENNDMVVVRLQECAGKEQSNVIMQIADSIEFAQEIYADETFKANANIEKGKLVFDIGKFEPKSFLLKVVKNAANVKPASCPEIKLPYNVAAITKNNRHRTATTKTEQSIPRELIPEYIYSGGIHFNISADSFNAVACNKQKLDLPKNTKRISFLACSLTQDKIVEFNFDGNSSKIKIASCNEAIGAWDLIGLKETGYIKRDVLAFSATHTHSKLGDIIGKQFYIFRYDITVPENTSSVTLPDDENILIFAANQDNTPELENANLLYDALEKRPFDYVISKEEEKLSKPTKIEEKLCKHLDRKHTRFIDAKMHSTAVQTGDIFYMLRSRLNGKK